MKNALFLVCNENPKVTDGLANLHKASKEIRDSMSTDNNPRDILSKQILKLRMTSHKIKQVNAPLRFRKALFVCSRLTRSFFHLKEYTHIHYKQNCTIINQNSQSTSLWMLDPEMIWRGDTLIWTTLFPIHTKTGPLHCGGAIQPWIVYWCTTNLNDEYSFGIA